MEFVGNKKKLAYIINRPCNEHFVNINILFKRILFWNISMIYGFIALISKQNRRFSLVPQLEEFAMPNLIILKMPKMSMLYKRLLVYISF